MRRTYFDIYRAECADGRFVVAKCAPNNEEEYRQALQAEFSALDELNRKTGEVLAGTIPHPIAFREKECMLLLTGIPGVPLEEKLKWYANVALGWPNLAKMREIGGNLGDWLKRFHHSTAAESQAHDHCEYLNRLDRNMSLSQQVGISRTVLARVRNRAEVVSNSLQGVLVCAAAAHGDFIPQNILVDELRVGVVDFVGYSSRAPVYRDLSAFLAYIALLASKVRYSSKALEVLVVHFLRRYGDRLNPSLLRIFVLKTMLQIVGDSPDSANSARRRRRIEEVLMGVADGTSWLDRSLKTLHPFRPRDTPNRLIST